VRCSASASKRENGNPDFVPAKAGNHYLRNWIPRIKCGAGPASAGMTNLRTANLNLKNLKTFGKSEENHQFSPIIGLI
jgi:hypothetical protein